MQGRIASGYRIAVDLDWAKFFDGIPPDVLMARVARKLGGKRLPARLAGTGPKLHAQSAINGRGSPMPNALRADSDSIMVILGCCGAAQRHDQLFRLEAPIGEGRIELGGVAPFLRMIFVMT